MGRLDRRIIVFGAVAMLVVVAAIADGQLFRFRRPCVVYCCTTTAPQQDTNLPIAEPDTKKIRAIIIGDNNDEETKGWNQAVIRNAAQISLVLSSMHEEIGSIQFITGKGVTRQNVLNYIRHIRVGPDDTLLVFYDGHGARDKERDAQADKGHYLKLLNNERIYRTEVLAAMATHSCRLQVLITDSCAAIEEDAKPSQLDGAMSKFKGELSSATKAKRSIFRKLLLEHAGLVDINSCQPDEEAIIDIFTPIFVDVGSNFDKDDESWDSYFKTVKTKTEAMAKDKLAKLKEDRGFVLGTAEKEQTSQVPIAFTINVRPVYDSRRFTNYDEPDIGPFPVRVLEEGTQFSASATLSPVITAAESDR